MFVSSMWRWSSSSGVPMNEPITRETTGPATSLTRSTLAPVRDPVEHPVDDLPDPLLVLGDPPRREAALEQGLDPVVARRVHRDHLLLLTLERDPEVVEDHDPADVGGERLASRG